MRKAKDIYQTIKQNIISLSKHLNLPVWQWLAISYSIVILILIIDFITTEQFSFAFFYLIPVCLVVWFVGERNGIIIALFTALTWVISDLIEHIYFSQWTLYLNAIVRLSFFVIIVMFLSAFKNALKREEELSRRDFLTGLANTRYFYELASLEIERSKRHIRYFTIIYLDIDNFKNINDHYGHSVGDIILRAVADSLKASLRKIDISARLGGDEFIILLSETGTEQAGHVAHKLHKNLTNSVNKFRSDVTFSFGVATFLKPPSSINDMIKIADTLMYSAKNSGKNMIKYDTVN